VNTPCGSPPTRIPQTRPDARAPRSADRFVRTRAERLDVLVAKADIMPDVRRFKGRGRVSLALDAGVNAHLGLVRNESWLAKVTALTNVHHGL